MTNLSTLNSAALNASAGAIVPTITGSGTLVSVQQAVYLSGSGLLLPIEQSIELYATGSGALIPIEQSITALAEGRFVPVNQSVVDVASIPAPGTVSGAYWDLTLVIDGYQIPSDQIHGDVRVSRSESSTALLDIALLPQLGVQSVNDYIGKPITLDVYLPEENTITRLYTGVVDIPEIDLIDKKITLRCSDRREELITNQIGPFLSTIGSYSDIIFPRGDDNNILRELDDRLSTTPTAVDFDAFGNLQITNWVAKATADFVLDDGDVFRRDPRVELTSRARITNTVDINFEYRYERLHHWEVDYRWVSPINSIFNLFLVNGYTMARKDMIRQAIDSAGWPLKNDITWTDIQPSGWYGGVAWSTTQLTGYSTPKKDSSGNIIRDSKGDIVYEGVVTGGTDLTQVYANGAEWTATFRWAQTVTEDYRLSVTAPQSVAQFGTVKQVASHGYTDPKESEGWENYEAYSATPGKTGTYFIEEDTDRGRVSNAIRVALLRAKNTILGSHRDTRVTFSRSIWPQIGLEHTVELNTTPVQCKGKVFQIEHYFNVTTREAVTEVTLVLSKAVGSASNSNFTAPSWSDDVVNLPSTQINLGNHFGINPDPAVTPGAELWTGMIGNSFNPGILRRTNYTERFVVDAPAIPAAVRDERVREKASDYTVEIPDDELIITF